MVDADRFGLAQLYQLRGRVGRSGQLAHAYFTTRENKVVSEEAAKRLTSLMDYNEFGSGFKIALRDLEIRGRATFWVPNSTGILRVSVTRCIRGF